MNARQSIYSAILPKVGLVLPYLKSRGTEKQALNLAIGLIARGVSVELFVVQGWGGEHMYAAFRDQGVRVTNIGEPIDLGLKRVSFDRLPLLTETVKNSGCSVLISRAGMTNRIASLAGREAGIPTVAVLSTGITARNYRRAVVSRLSGLWRSRKEYERLGRPSLILSVSAETRRRFQARFPLLRNRVVAVPNGVRVENITQLSQQTADLEPELEKQPDQFLIGYSGSLELDRKGLDVLLSAVHALVYRYSCSHVKLVLVGDGPDKDAIAERIDELNLVDHVSLLGECPNPYPVISQCEVFVLPSRREGLPNALLEAMALGVCSVAADCDTGPREIIETETNGLLVPVGDVPGLAEALRRLCVSPAVRRRFARTGRQTILENFTFDQMIDGYQRVIASLTG